MKQAEKIYLISDAAKQVQVESHVLRYWEEELKLPIKRNEMGHRYYTQEDIARFQEIKDLKEQGLQLKAIRNMLQRGKLGVFDLEERKGDMAEKNLKEEGMKRHVVMVNKGEFVPVTEECVFRGLIFRNLWKTSAIAAYLVSMAAFSAVHIVSYIGVYCPLHLVLAFLQYLPAGIWLAWCYTKSGSIFGPIVMHAIINLYSLNLLR